MRRLLSLLHFLPDNRPACNERVVVLNVAEDQAVAFEAIGPDLPRSHVTSVGRHVRQMNDLVLLHVDFLFAAVSQGAFTGGKFFLGCGMHRVGPTGTIGVYKLSAHVTIALVNEEALSAGFKEGTGRVVPSFIISSIDTSFQVPTIRSRIADSVSAEPRSRRQRIPRETARKVSWLFSSQLLLAISDTR
jgi:hypothetical protein